MTAKASLIGCVALFCGSGCAFALDPDQTPGESGAGETPAADSVAGNHELPRVDPLPPSCARYQKIVFQGTVVMIPTGCTSPGRNLGDPAPLVRLHEPSEILGNTSPYTLPAGIERQATPPSDLPWDELPPPDGDPRPPD